VASCWASAIAPQGVVHPERQGLGDVEHGVPRERGGERGGAVEPAPGDQQASGRTGIVAAVTGARQMLDTVSTGLGMAVSVGLDATQKAGSINHDRRCCRRAPCRRPPSHSLAQHIFCCSSQPSSGGRRSSASCATSNVPVPRVSKRLATSALPRG